MVVTCGHSHELVIYDCVELELSTVSPYACLCVLVWCAQAPMRVVSTTAVAAACASPYQVVGGAPAPKTKYWTLPTTRAAKVGARMPECRIV